MHALPTKQAPTITKASPQISVTYSASWVLQTPSTLRHTPNNQLETIEPLLYLGRGPTVTSLLRLSLGFLMSALYCTSTGSPIIYLEPRCLFLPEQQLHCPLQCSLVTLSSAVFLSYTVLCGVPIYPEPYLPSPPA